MNSGPTQSSVAVDNRLAFLDQASFLRLRATGVETVGQAVWVYDRPVDMDGLRRFNENLGQGLLGRRIERSPLPFGRHRWVAWHEPPDIDVASSPRPRSEVSAWIDERAQIRVDPEYGPCWHLGVLPLEDGGTAVSLVTSHTVADGIVVMISAFEAINGQTRCLGYPPPRARSRPRAVLVDGLDFLRGLAAVFGALVACLLLLLKRGREIASQPKSPPASASRAGGDEPYVLPALTLFLGGDAWDARAREMGGTGNSLFIAFATGLAERMGRVSPVDGAVTIAVPVSERGGADDLRGNALTGLDLRVDPALATTDLQIIRNEMKQGLAALQHTPNELLKPLPLIPLTPRWLAKRMEGLALGNAEMPVCCSNLRDLPDDLLLADGTKAERFLGRMFNQGVTGRAIEAAHGQLYLFSGRINGQVFISIIGYQPGAENSKDYLRATVEQALADFRLTTDTEL
ncbi:MAG TPA: hypothetical protein VN255_10405 [Mycobacterium sp.]|nr:hypothetical protein [Mycobacterium sp.]